MAATVCFQQGMANPTIAYGMDAGTNNVAVNTFTYQTVPTEQQQTVPSSQPPIVQSPLQPVAMHAQAGMAANSAYQILLPQPPQQQVQGSPTTTQQQQQQQQQQEQQQPPPAVVSLPQTSHSDYGTPEGREDYIVG